MKKCLEVTDKVLNFAAVKEDIYVIYKRTDSCQQPFRKALGSG